MTKFVAGYRKVNAVLVLACFVIASTGCITTTASRVEAFISIGQSYIGKTISQSERRGLIATGIGIKSLPNGNFEKEYGNIWMRKKNPKTQAFTYPCHFFLEYEPQSEVIVKFRFEEKFENACQGSGV